MSEKKQRGRFTLQFNMEDPQQRTASELLEQQGRHKAQFITSAILQYMRSPDPQGSVSASVVDKGMLEQMLLAIIEKHPQLTGTSPPVRTEQTPKPTSGGKVWNDTIGSDAMTAISETLAAFQQG